MEDHSKDSIDNHMETRSMSEPAVASQVNNSGNGTVERPITTQDSNTVMRAGRLSGQENCWTYEISLYVNDI